jgi:F-type H+-transporting ATPase subunit alpha
MKKVSSSLKLDLAQYNEMLSFAQFGSDLDANTKKIIDHGARVTELLKQPQYSPMSMADQVLSLYMAKNHEIDEVPVEEVASFEKFMHKFFHEKYEDLVKEIEAKEDISDELNAKLHDAMDEALDQYRLLKGAAA